MISKKIILIMVTDDSVMDDYSSGDENDAIVDLIDINPNIDNE